jgi:hypothetical protein
MFDPLKVNKRTDPTTLCIIGLIVLLLFMCILLINSNLSIHKYAHNKVFISYVDYYKNNSNYDETYIKNNLNLIQNLNYSDNDFMYILSNNYITNNLANLINYDNIFLVVENNKILGYIFINIIRVHHDGTESTNTISRKQKSILKNRLISCDIHFVSLDTGKHSDGVFIVDYNCETWYMDEITTPRFGESPPTITYNYINHITEISDISLSIEDVMSIQSNYKFYSLKTF